MESEVIATYTEVTMYTKVTMYTEVTTYTEVIAMDTDQKREQRESAYISRKYMWRTLLEPLS